MVDWKRIGKSIGIGILFWVVIAIMTGGRLTAVVTPSAGTSGGFEVSGDIFGTGGALAILIIYLEYRFGPRKDKKPIEAAGVKKTGIV